MTNRTAIPVTTTISPEQLSVIDDFQRTEGISSREEVLQLLLEIALDTINGTGRRFWDKPGQENEERSKAREIYRSSNGDLWQLLNDDASGRMHVRHTPNPASGGLPVNMEVEEFLSPDRGGPEHAALRAMLGSSREGT